jgi:hypothetical protein
VLAWQEKEEHSLFYTLYKDMPVIKTHDNYSNFSNDYNKNKVDFSLNKYQHDTRQLVSRKPQYQYGNSYSNGERYSILFDSQFTPTWGKNWLDNQLSKLFQGFNPTDNSRTLYLGWQYNQPGETTWLVSLKSNEHSNISNKFNLSQQHNYAPKLQTASVGKPIPENTAMPTAKQNNPDSNINASEVKALAVPVEPQQPTHTGADSSSSSSLPGRPLAEVQRPTILAKPHPEMHTFNPSYPVAGELPKLEGFPAESGVPPLTLLFNEIREGSKEKITNLPSKSSNWVKLRGNQGSKNVSDGSIWKKDMLHKEHWDVSDSKGNKIKEIDFSGKQIWPGGPKNKNKFPKNKD